MAWISCNEPDGQGIYTWATGEKYAGVFKAGKKQGLGTFTFADGTEYVGEFENDVFHGQGTMTDADGARFVGLYQSGKAFQGTEYDKDGKDIATYSEGVRSSE